MESVGDGTGKPQQPEKTGKNGSASDAASKAATAGTTSTTTATTTATVPTNDNNSKPNPKSLEKERRLSKTSVGSATPSAPTSVLNKKRRLSPSKQNASSTSLFTGSSNVALNENRSEEENEDVFDPEEKERQRIRALLTLFTPEQMRRYEHFRRSHFNRKKVKKIMQDVSGCSVNDELAIAMGGAAKIFAGELIESARLIMEKAEEDRGPIRPSHVLSAYAQIKREDPELLPPGAIGLRKRKLLRR
mmetsp:Transcript_32375/g.39848  ORF Transcript_32375/g.39848 Transcript_32375/m.39848 type:complete len:247 (-) Transcript_32375:632-1372(-)